MALLIDTLIQSAVFIILGIAYFAMEMSLGNSGKLHSSWVIAIFGLAFFCLYWGYFAAFEVLWKGQTPGKRVAGIRVIKDTGRPVNVFEAITRNVLRAVDSLLFYGVGVVTMLLNSRNRRLGDFVAGSLVVHESAAREAELFFNTSAQSGSAFHQAAGLTLQEVELMETFLARRLDIPSEVRRVNAARIAHMIATRLGIPSEARPEDNENFLEIMVREFRNRATFRSN